MGSNLRYNVPGTTIKLSEVTAILLYCSCFHFITKNINKIPNFIFQLAYVKTYSHDSHACDVAMKETLFCNKGGFVEKNQYTFCYGLFSRCCVTRLQLLHWAWFQRVCSNPIYDKIKECFILGKKSTKLYISYQSQDYIWKQNDFIRIKFLHFFIK